MYIPSLLNLPPTFYPIQPFWVVTEHQIWALCILQEASTGYLILHMVMYMFHATLSIRPTLSTTLSFCLHLYYSPTDEFISTIFLDSIHMH